jgi:hypothetical protein
MDLRHTAFDVTNQVNTMEPDAVEAEVLRILARRYRGARGSGVSRSFDYVHRLYLGKVRGYAACDTPYHDLQHVLEVTLAMARLMDGHEALGSAPPLGQRLFEFGIVCALFHDGGYVRRAGDRRHPNGAAYTRTHVSRGVRMLRAFLPTIGMSLLVPGAMLLHYTGYEVPVPKIRLEDPRLVVLGRMLGSADILAQMSDRCYLEKCYFRLYPEFVIGGIDRRRNPDGTVEVIFASAQDLIFKTPAFYRNAMSRLDRTLGGVHRAVEAHFGGNNPYLAEIGANIRHAESIASSRKLSLLRRQPRATVPPMVA